MTGLTADVEAFLARLVRLDAGALVRIRSLAGELAAERTAMWGRVPWDVLVSRTISGLSTGTGDAADVVVRARDWLASGTADIRGLARLDAAWRSPLPPDERAVLEEIPAAALRELGAAAADTLRAAETSGVGGRAVGSRAVRDALLDHVAIVVSAGDRRVDVPQRLVQAVVRMGFAAADEPVRVLSAGTWTGLAATYGSAWWRPPTGLTVAPRDRKR